MNDLSLEEMVNHGTVDTNVSGYSKLPSPVEVINEIPLTRENEEFILRKRKEIKNILDKKDNRKIIIAGPCSIHDPLAGLEYARRLKEISDEVCNEVLIVMRAYFEKPRTTIGWKGLIYDPYLDSTNNISKGIKIARKFLRDVTEIGLPCATEFLNSVTPQYLNDYLCWAAIGARTTESQVHREITSGLSVPVGFKNGTSGDIGVAVDAVRAANHPQAFLGIDPMGYISQVNTKGNPYCHIVLRGGNGVPNCSPELVNQTVNLMKAAKIPVNIIVDCSHGNSMKKYEKQQSVAYMVLDQITSGTREIVGIMLESNLIEGKQEAPKTKEDIKRLLYGQSITDGCESIERTTETIRKYSDRLKN